MIGKGAWRIKLKTSAVVRSINRLVAGCLVLMIGVILVDLLDFATAKSSREACFIVKNKIR